MKMTYKQMIALFLAVAVLFMLINFQWPQYGPWVTMGGMIIIFVIFKAYQFFKKTEEEKEE
ncbi:MAG: hypothetical protein ACLFVB_03240 [Thermoplasmata archaeon]